MINKEIFFTKTKKYWGVNVGEAAELFKFARVTFRGMIWCGKVQSRVFVLIQCWPFDLMTC